MTISKIVLATNNPGKISEMMDSLSHLTITCIPQSEFAIRDIEETGTTFVENAIIKARHASEYSKLPALADDSGLVIPALNQAPGVYSARYAGKGASSQDRIQKVLSELNAIPNASRRAAFWCILALIRNPQDPTPLIFQGKWEGEILEAPRGDRGFGYDPIFFVPAYQCSAAELVAQKKNRISHRAQAMRQCVAWLDARGFELSE